MVSLLDILLFPAIIMALIVDAILNAFSDDPYP